jgi:hypothetical protein
MPGYDGNGPRGQGPRTGGGFGYCGTGSRPVGPFSPIGRQGGGAGFGGYGVGRGGAPFGGGRGRCFGGGRQGGRAGYGRGFGGYGSNDAEFSGQLQQLYDEIAGLREQINRITQTDGKQD